MPVAGEATGATIMVEILMETVGLGTVVALVLVALLLLVLVVLVVLDQ
jgi:hypothetical protein